MSKEKKEILLNIHSNIWDSDMPVTFIRYNNGSMDVHCQTGDHHEEAIMEAAVILARRGLRIKDIDDGALYGTGVYYSVVEKK